MTRIPRTAKKIPSMRRYVAPLLIFAWVFSALPQFAYATTDTFTLTQNTNAGGFGAWVVPAGVSTADVACWGGGGAGFTGNTAGGGAGGGGGAFASSTIPSLVAGTSYTIFVGAGGATSGAAGADSTFATTTVVADGGTGGTDETTGVGTGGTIAGSTGDVENDGGNGGTGADDGAQDLAGGGGGAGGPHGDGSVGGNADAGANIGGVGGTGDAGSGGTAGAAGDGGGPAANGGPGGTSINGGGGGGGADNGGIGGAGGSWGGGGGGGETAMGAGEGGACTVTYTEALAPTVTTDSAHSLSPSFANLFGSITDIGGASPTARGFAISTDSTLSINVSTTTENGSFGVGSFTYSTTTLAESTTYYYRAYAEDGDTGFGAILSFNTSGHGVARKMRLFEGFTIKLVSNKIKLLW